MKTEDSRLSTEDFRFKNLDEILRRDFKTKFLYEILRLKTENIRLKTEGLRLKTED